MAEGVARGGQDGDVFGAVGLYGEARLEGVALKGSVREQFGLQSVLEYG